MKPIFLFDDPEIDAHIRALQKLAPPRRRNKELRMPLHFGIVRHWNADASFGFIGPDSPIPEVTDRDGDIFVGARSLRRSGLDRLVRGQRVAFDVKAARQAGRYEAINVQLLEDVAAEAA
jgi:cold shock CspA family protein